MTSLETFENPEELSEIFTKYKPAGIPAQSYLLSAALNGISLIIFPILSVILIFPSRMEAQWIKNSSWAGLGKNLQ